MPPFIQKPLVPPIGDLVFKADYARVRRLKRAEKRRIMEEVVVFTKRGDL